MKITFLLSLEGWVGLQDLINIEGVEDIMGGITNMFIESKSIKTPKKCMLIKSKQATSTIPMNKSDPDNYELNSDSINDEELMFIIEDLN